VLLAATGKSRNYDILVAMRTVKASWLRILSRIAVAARRVATARGELTSKYHTDGLELGIQDLIDSRPVRLDLDDQEGILELIE